MKIKRKWILINSSCIKSEILPIEIDRFGSWKKLIRVTAYVFMFGKKKKDVGDMMTIGDDEIQRAERYWILHAQRQLPDDQEINLVPFNDEDGVIHIHGRIENSDVFD